MSARNRRGTCAYCGEQRKLTKDHVPPKLLLEHPYPPNLWTVPACAECNSSFKADDEYSQAILAVDIRATWNSAAQSNLRSIIHSQVHPNAQGFAQYLASQTSFSRVVTPSGMPVMTIKPDWNRLNKTGLRIMRGLYYRETGKPVPPGAAIRLESKAGLTADHPDMLTIAGVWNSFSDHRNGATGTAFSYTAAFGGGASVWLMLLYDYFFWAGTVDERDVSERNRSPEATL